MSDESLRLMYPVSFPSLNCYPFSPTEEKRSLRREETEENVTLAESEVKSVTEVNFVK
jgi:hypothetical protein